MDRTILAGLLGLVSWLLLIPFASAGTLEFASAAYSVAENGSTFVVTVNRAGTVAADASVTVKSVDGTAIVTEDFQNVATVLSWTAGELDPKTVIVTILDDDLVEATENFQLDLINPVGDTVGGVGSATVTLTDFEEGNLQFSASSYDVAENTASVTLSVIRSDGSDGDVTVDYATADDTALEISDYIAATGTLEFADGELSKDLVITIVDDEVGELEQSLQVALTNVTGGASIGTTNSTEIVISDTDVEFTSAMTKLSATLEDTVQLDAIDLAQASFSDAEMSLLDTVNDIDVLSTTDLVAEQDSQGQVSIVVGDEIFFFRPLQVLRSAVNTVAGIFINPDNSGLFRTTDGIDILFQPALEGIEVLQAALTEIDLPELEINQYGNITVQADQGPPPLEQDETGELVVNNSFYDRFNLRPNSISVVSDGSIEGTELAPHPVFPNESMLLVNYTHNSELRQQVLTTAPVDTVEFLSVLESLAEFESAEMQNLGITSTVIAGQEYLLFAQYIIRNVENFSLSKVGITAAGDVNEDGVEDLIMTYSSGDEQTFTVHPVGN